MKIKHFKWLVVLIFSLLIIAACGRKGPLFLPQESAQEAQNTVQPVPKTSVVEREATETQVDAEQESDQERKKPAQ